MSSDCIDPCDGAYVQFGQVLEITIYISHTDRVWGVYWVYFTPFDHVMIEPYYDVLKTMQSIQAKAVGVCQSAALFRDI